MCHLTILIELFHKTTRIEILLKLCDYFVSPEDLTKILHLLTINFVSERLSLLKTLVD